MFRNCVRTCLTYGCEFMFSEKTGSPTLFTVITHLTQTSSTGHCLHWHGTLCRLMSVILTPKCLFRQNQASSLDDQPVNKAKYTLVQVLRLCTGPTAHRGSRGIALLFLDHGTRRGWGVSVTSRLLFTPGKDSIPIVQEAGWATGPVWTGEENLAPTGIRSPDRPARSQSLYRLRYPAHIRPERGRFIQHTPLKIRVHKIPSCFVICVVVCHTNANAAVLLDFVATAQITPICWESCARLSWKCLQCFRLVLPQLALVLLYEAVSQARFRRTSLGVPRIIAE